MPLAIVAGKRVVAKTAGNADVSRIVPDPFVYTQVHEPWVAALGDCFFFRLCEEIFVNGPLHPDDCPAIICYPRGRIAMTMDLAEHILPRGLETLFVHLGSNDLSSPSSNPDEVAANLEQRLWRLQTLLPHLRTVVICLLTSRTTDLEGRYDMPYIRGCNERMARYNWLVRSGRIRGLSFTVRYLDFYLERKNLSSFLRPTGFGLNSRGRTHIGGIMENLILKELRLQRNPVPLAYAVPPNYHRQQEDHWNYWNYKDWPVPGQQQQSRNLPRQFPALSPTHHHQWLPQTSAASLSDYRPSSIGSTFSELSTLSSAYPAPRNTNQYMFARRM